MKRCLLILIITAGCLCSQTSRAQNYEQGIKEINSFLATRPNEPAYYLLRGTFESILQRYEPAVADISKSIDLNVRQHYPWGKEDQNIREFLQQFPANLLYQAYTVRAEANLHLKFYKAAAEDYNIAIKYEPGSVKDLSGRMQAFFYLKRYEESLTDVNAVLRQTSDPSCMNFRASIYMYMGRYQEALDQLKQLISSHTENAHYKSGLGYVYFLMGRYQDSEKCYAEVFESIPDDFITLCQRANLYSREGKYLLALADDERALELVPMPAGNNYMVNMILSDIATGAYEKAGKNWAQVNANNIGSYVDAGDLGFLKIYIEVMTNDVPNGRYSLALSRLLDIEKRASSSNLNELNDPRGEYVHVLVKIGWLLEKLDRKQDALTYYKRAAAINPLCEDVRGVIRRRSS